MAPATRILHRYLVCRQQVEASGFLARHGVDDQDVLAVFKKMQSINAAGPAIDDVDLRLQ